MKNVFSANFFWKYMILNFIFLKVVIQIRYFGREGPCLVLIFKLSFFVLKTIQARLMFLFLKTIY